MLYDSTIPAYINGLRSLSGQLAKALAWGADNGVGELQFVVARLAPDMFPLAAQVRSSCSQAIQAATRLGAAGAPDLGEDATDFAGLQAQIATTLAWLDGLDRTAIENSMRGPGGSQRRTRPFSRSAASLPNSHSVDLENAALMKTTTKPTPARTQRPSKGSIRLSGMNFRAF